MNTERFDDVSRAWSRGTSRRQALTLLGGGLLGGTALATGLGSVAAKSRKGKGKGQNRAGKAANPFANIPVKGHGSGGVQFKGLLDITQFSTDGQQLFASGTLTGQLTHGRQSSQDVPPTDVTLPVALPRSSGHSTSSSAARVQAAATCPILHLTLGPLDLNLLGLMIHLDQVVLNIDAQSGPGNLLGNLLCGIAGLPDQGLSLSDLLNQIVDLLNNFLAGIGGL